jgi:hypothetical protein
MSQSQSVQLRSLKRTYQVERSNGGKVTVHHFDEQVANCFPKRGYRTERKMESLRKKIKNA